MSFNQQRKNSIKLYLENNKIDDLDGQIKNMNLILDKKISKEDLKELDNFHLSDVDEINDTNNKIKSLEKNAALKKQRAKEALKNKNKDRAKLNLRQAKMYEAQIKTADGQLEMIETQITQIGTAQSQRDAMDVLK